MANALDELRSTTKESRTKWRMQQEARRARITDLVNAGVSTLGAATRGAKAARSFDENWLDGLKASVDRHLAMYQLLERIFGEDHGITREFSDRLRKATNMQNDIKRSAQRRFDDAARNALGFDAGQRGMRVRLAIDKALHELMQPVTGAVSAFHGREIKRQKISVALAEKIVRGELKDAANGASGPGIASQVEEEGDVIVKGASLPPLTPENIDQIREELALHRERMAERDFEKMYDENAGRHPGRSSSLSTSS